MTAALRESSLLCLSRRATFYAYAGLGMVAMVSTIFAIFQAAGYTFWPTYLNYHTGLFYSPIAQGGFLGLVIVSLMCIRYWILIPIPLLGLYINPNRGAWIIIGVGLLALLTRRPLVILLMLLVAAFILTTQLSLSDAWRVAIWYSGISNFSWFGNGIGSFDDVWLITEGQSFHPIHAHNDYIQLVYELGLFSIPIFCLLIYALFQTQSRDWPILVAYSAMACFTMPSYIPATAGIGALALASILTGVENG